MSEPKPVEFDSPAVAHRLKLETLPAGTPRPLWSVMIPTHHCAKYLRQTLESALAQAPSPEQMQIEVVEVVRETNRGLCRMAGR